MPQLRMTTGTARAISLTVIHTPQANGIAIADPCHDQERRAACRHSHRSRLLSHCLLVCFRTLGRELLGSHVSGAR